LSEEVVKLLKEISESVKLQRHSELSVKEGSRHGFFKHVPTCPTCKPEWDELIKSSIDPIFKNIEEVETRLKEGLKNLKESGESLERRLKQKGLI